jgi:hypothetical protein
VAGAARGAVVVAGVEALALAEAIAFENKQLLCAAVAVARELAAGSHAHQHGGALVL